MSDFKPGDVVRHDGEEKEVETHSGYVFFVDGSYGWGANCTLVRRAEPTDEDRALRFCDNDWDNVRRDNNIRNLAALLAEVRAEGHADACEAAERICMEEVDNYLRSENAVGAGAAEGCAHRIAEFARQFRKEKQ